MTPIYAREKFCDVIEEAKPLLEQHWLELARNRDLITLDPDYGRYARLEELGVLKVYTVRDHRALIGYAAYLVSPHLHYKRDLFALCDILWVRPDCRRGRVGINLLRFVENCLREDGVSVMHTTGKEAHPALAVVLKHLGHTHIEFGYAKVLKEGV